ncbi:MAG: hypothetical protein K6G58_03075 [Lachnospiraceae bacterium]|nr:hypothetical protein [Lachnospiraceae bacterium]
MKKFIGKILILLLAVSLCMFLAAALDFFAAGSQYGYNYQASALDKAARLRATESPKIILVGNSNLPFGIDSALLEKETGLPVVNLGLHAGLGNAFHEEFAKMNIKEGDLVIVCHTYYDDEDDIPSPSLAWITIDNHPEMLGILRLRDMPGMLAAYPNYLRKSFSLWLTKDGNKDEGGSYSRSAFNEYGDVIFKPAEKQMDPEEYFSDTSAHPVKAPKTGRMCMSRLNRYNEYVSSRGASLLIAGYPIAYGRYSDFDEADIAGFQAELEDSLDCTVISDFTDYMYPYEYFYDTYLHLKKDATEVRTMQLADDINRWMGGR